MRGFLIPIAAGLLPAAATAGGNHDIARRLENQIVPAHRTAVPAP